LTAEHEQAAKASPSQCERDGLPRDRGGQQSNDALKQQAAQLNDQIAGRKTEQPPRQAGRRSSGALASLTAEHEQAAKAVADANAERDRAAGETAAAQQSGDALKQQVAQLNDQIAGRKTEQPASTSSRRSPGYARQLDGGARTGRRGRRRRNAERGRDVAAAQQSNDAPKQQVAS